jgi:hypothetical protein
MNTRLFISWSGNAGQKIAGALARFLPSSFSGFEPFVSTAIGSGRRWNIELVRELEKAACGIICITPENVLSPWLIFEAGALSVTEREVCPYLHEVESEQLAEPLRQFQAKRATQKDTRELLRDLCCRFEPEQTDFDNRFEAFWARFQNCLKSLPEFHPPESDIDRLQKSLDLLRAENRQLREDMLKEIRDALFCRDYDL